MKSHTLLLIFLLISFIITGCGSTGAFNAANLTEVQLSEGNYEVVATNVRGKASAGYIFGISGNGSGQIHTFAVARILGSGMLYGEAVENLWENFREKYGKTEGRKLALTNIRYDTDALNLIVFTKPTVSVRADIVEFK